MSNEQMRNYQVNFVTLNARENEKDKKHALDINFGGTNKGLYPDFSAISVGDAVVGKDGHIRDKNTGAIITQSIIDYAKIAENNAKRKEKEQDDLTH